ncbi:hypothetical protein VCRA2128O309_1090005 [Vibrio crassostreae]|nr:hypothetical protein VCRA2128O309_1090005 [Vibrio crassostreae]CAK3034599.1 hypothetical protein VCRA2121O264_500005 [Vibrio crassostreae]
MSYTTSPKPLANIYSYSTGTLDLNGTPRSSDISVALRSYPKL